jgi:ribosomal protein S18 acetylase RimI-like enzyme
MGTRGAKRILAHACDGRTLLLYLLTTTGWSGAHPTVRPARHPRSGHGSALLREALELARRRGAESLFLEVRPSNFAAQALYRRFGFQRIAVRRGYYPSHFGREDALVYTIEIP